MKLSIEAVDDVEVADVVLFVVVGTRLRRM